MPLTNNVTKYCIVFACTGFHFVRTAMVRFWRNVANTFVILAFCHYAIHENEKEKSFDNCFISSLVLNLRFILAEIPGIFSI